MGESLSGGRQDLVYSPPKSLRLPRDESTPSPLAFPAVKAPQ